MSEKGVDELKKNLKDELKEELKGEQNSKKQQAHPHPEESEESKEKRDQSLKNSKEDSLESPEEKSSKSGDDVSKKEEGEGKDSTPNEQEDFKAKFYYLAAEMDNMKKRFEREKSNLIKFGNEKVLSQLLEVVDNLDRTVDAIVGDEDEKIKNISQGVEMVRTQFLGVLKGNGLEKLNSLGEIFDPNFHEAMAQMPAEGKKEQEIIQVYQHGYSLNGRLIRPAKVVIANNS